MSGESWYRSDRQPASPPRFLAETTQQEHQQAMPPWRLRLPPASGIIRLHSKNAHFQLRLDCQEGVR
jgi:hypothetical protein